MPRNAAPTPAPKPRRQRRLFQGCLLTVGALFACGVLAQFLPDTTPDTDSVPQRAVVVELLTATPTTASSAGAATDLPPTLSPADTPSTPAETALSELAQVVHIVDGDTIDVAINGAEYRVRYILVDTPEQGMPYYSEATAANWALVGGQTVTLQKDVSETDRYGRLLRYVYRQDGLFVNAELVRQGYAQIATFPPDVAKEAEIRAAQAEAIAAQRPRWAAIAAPVEQAPAPAQVWPSPAVVTVPTASQSANLRSGPGEDYPVVGSVAAGQPLMLNAFDPTGAWYQLADGAWIAAWLVAHADQVVGLAVTTNYPPPPAPTPTPAPVIVDQPTQAAPASVEPPVQQPVGSVSS